MARKLLSAKNTNFVGWQCSACGWSAPLPRLSSSDKNPPEDVVATFNEHKCANNPRKKKREDFSQAAARIVREATKGE